MRDLVGLGWRPELAGDILENLDRVDVVEVLAEGWLGSSRRKQRALQTLGTQVPVLLHGVSLGLASAAPVEPRRLDRFARLVDAVQPVSWSEHLAFVRGGGIEIGHLAAPPRTKEVVESTARNVLAAQERIGSAPLLENVASLIEPPGSDLGEVEWLCAAVEATGCELLLDLHNLYANAVNHGFDARDAIRSLPADRIGAVHLAGGSTIGPRLLDDHLHAVPEAVFELLALVAELAPRPLTVIVERDGAYPPFSVLAGELDRARRAVEAGRTRRNHDHRL
jgi:uncharacterized protein (UPF0276 family)